jgi:predicted MPP superfamily phosphohydrolase
MLIGAFFLFLAASIGHAALLVFPINWLYGCRSRDWWVTGLRHLCSVLIVCAPLAFLYQWGHALWAGGAWTALPWPLLSYLSVCWYLGLVVVPYQTVKRWLRRPPALQLSNHTATVDVAQQLGRKLYGRGKHALLARLPRNEIFQVDFIERTFQLPQLPASWEGLTILHVTDLHLCGVPDRSFYEYVMERCAEPPADLVAITGDILDSKTHHHWIIPVLGRLRWRVAAFAILGNHDLWWDVQRISRRVERIGIEMMGQRWKRIIVRDEPLVIIGNEMPWLPPEPDLTDCPAEGFRLCLSHTPDTLPWARRHHIDLLLAGHNHGGQVRLPGFGPILVPSRYSRRYDCGTFHEPPTLMHVSRGLGGTYPLRYNCRPEVTRIILRKGGSRKEES